MQPFKVIISGGGTGGHIFPAIAIANALKEKVNNIEILFVGAKGRMEMEKVPAAGYKIEGLWISGIQRKLSAKNLLFPFKVLSSVYNSFKIIRRFKPDVVVGVGGYASGPLLYAATVKGIPSVIQEQNSYAGITNKILGSRVDKICVAYDGMEKFFPKNKIILTGNPVRQDILNLSGKKERGYESFGLKQDKPVVLIIGGSLGARTINESLLNAVRDFSEQNIQVLWQTGKAFATRANEFVKEHRLDNIKVSDFITKMDLAYAVADVVVSRAGASSISELCLVQKPVILIPSPNVAEDHQTRNALALVNHHAAILVKDVDAKERLKEEIISIVRDKERQQKLSDNISKLAFKDSAAVIASEVLSLIKRK